MSAHMQSASLTKSLPSTHYLIPKQIIKQALKGFRYVATTTTTALGNVVSEIAGSSVLQPNSPQAMVLIALESAHKTKLILARPSYILLLS